MSNLTIALVGGICDYRCGDCLTLAELGTERLQWQRRNLFDQGLLGRGRDEFFDLPKPSAAG